MLRMDKECNGNHSKHYPTNYDVKNYNFANKISPYLLKNNSNTNL